MDIKKHYISVQDAQINFLCGENESILAAMIRNGQGPLTHGCFGGGCGICRMQIVSGEYSCHKRMSVAHISEQDKKHDIVLLCCVQPRSDMTVATVKIKK